MTPAGEVPSGTANRTEPLPVEEPGIMPPPIEPVAGGRPGEVTIRAAAALAKIRWQPRPGQSSAAAGRAKAKYLATKLGVINSAGGKWLDDLQAAISASAIGEAGDPSAEALICAAGVKPLCGPPAASSEHFSAPILRRYRNAQIETSRRFRLDHDRIGAVRGGPTISLLMPAYRTPIIFLEWAILSVVCQTYADWELCIVDDGSRSADIAAILDYYEVMDKRIRVACNSENAGISKATNTSLELASGSYVGLLDNDDIITHDALEIVAKEIRLDPTLDVIYSDECKIDENDIAGMLFSKPDWSPMLLTAFMYTGHFSVYRASLVRKIGGFRSEFDFSQDYDLALRVAERQPVVRHVREYLYGWRMIRGSGAAGDKPYARESNIAALQDAMDRRGWGGTAVALPMANRALRRFEGEQPLVSIVIPTGGNVQLLSGCLSAIFGRTTYQNLEIIIVHNTDTKPEVFPYLNEMSGDPRISIIDTKRPFNFSQSCNVGAARASGAVVIFYNDDVFVITPDWIQAILECLTLPGVGIVGPKLLYENHGIQHAGMVTGTRRLLGTAFHTFPRYTPAHVNLAQSVREVSLISGACLAMSKAVFDEVGGYDEMNAPRDHSDVDLCLRVRELGYSCIYTPHGELTHVGHVSMGAEEAAGKVYSKNKHDIFIMKRFGIFLADDPYFPKTMRDLLYINSQEEFRFFPRSSPPPVGERRHTAPAMVPSGATARQAAAHGPIQALDILIFSHDLTESGAPRVVFERRAHSPRCRTFCGGCLAQRRPLSGTSLQHRRQRDRQRAVAHPGPYRPRSRPQFRQGYLQHDRLLAGGGASSTTLSQSIGSCTKVSQFTKW